MSGDFKISFNQMRIRYVLPVLIFFELVTCKNISDKTITKYIPGKDEMANLNSTLLQKDRERIQNYIERKNLKMAESPTGLWYGIKNEGSGKFFTDNNKVVFSYECSLLDGTNCYSSQSLGLKEVILGKSGIESGLDEGLRMLKPGAEATFILPPFLAYGLIGDGKMIPARAVIVYKVNILRPE
jgi:FKBP-type peptidyl-prolyl cis-trans isomerase FkpA